MDESGKVLGVDFGEKRIGLAIGVNGWAEPFSIVEVDDPPSLKLRGATREITKICQQEKIKAVVLGLPLDSEGQIGPAAKKVKEFGQKLSVATGLKVTFWDETLTSEEALSKMVEAGRPRKKRRRLDDVVAALILQEYLDSI